MNLNIYDKMSERKGEEKKWEERIYVCLVKVTIYIINFLLR